MRNKIILVITSLIIATSLTGCSGSGGGTYSESSLDNTFSINSNIGESYVDGFNTSKSNSYYNSDYSESYDYEDTYNEDYKQLDEQDKQKAEITLSKEKLVYNCNLDIETTHYETSLQSIMDLIDKHGAIVQTLNESDSAYDWYYSNYKKSSGTLSCYMQLRVPSNKYNEFVNGLGEIDGKVKSKNQSVDNISQEYFDTEVTIQSLEKEEERLLEMLDKATTIDEMIEVESRLQEVDRALMSNKTEMKYMDIDVAYSYVNLNLSEVIEYTQDDEGRKTNTFIDRLKNAMNDSIELVGKLLEGLLFTVIILIPYIVIAVVVVVVYRIATKKKRKQKKLNKNMSVREMTRTLDQYTKELEQLKAKETEDKNIANNQDNTENK